MSDLECQEKLARMTIPELIAAVTTLTEEYYEHLALITHEILIRSMQQAE